MNPSSLRTPLMCLGLLALAACGGKDRSAQTAPPPPRVGVVTVAPTNQPLTKDLVGRLSPYRSADVRARVAGVLLKRVYDEGSDVKKGQLLFQIDPAPLKAALDAAQANLAQARASYTNAKVAADRVRELAPKGYVSRSDLDNALAAERTAAASVQQAQANVQTARINLGYASVTAPIDGRAGKQQVTEGALVGQGGATLLTTVDQIDPLYVNFSLSTGELDQMRRAQADGSVTLSAPDKASVDIGLPDGSRYPQQGTVDFSDTTVNPATGSVDLRATVPNPDHVLLPGMYVTLKARLGERHKVFLVPQPALQRDTGGAYLMVIGKDGKVERKSVTADQSSGSDWVVTSGLAANDKVIVSGLQKVKEGAPATAEPWTPGPSGTPAAGSRPAASAK
ncbi:MAG: efflux RND transporter periplasmic adaptor subunit [Xanthomonadaceae bacterium]|nr:efflux RND transporter periplasmic adaptor subunit [Xanthomonadaceae bacterium]MDE1964422.1 efflux RND transporter periplasmic adaptor subunit [Xanthomonadaceae bacterium]